MPEFYTTEDFVIPIECLSEALGSTQQLIDSYKYAIELLKKVEVE